MFLSPSKPDWHKIDNKWVHTDSQMEATIIKRLVTHGFGGGFWHRYMFGIATSMFRYTPDVHLSILHDEMNRRALVEFKAISTKQFPKKDRLRMIASSKFFQDAVCFLYIERTKRWYLIEPTGKLLKVNEPKPGFVPVSQLPKPRILIPYYNSFTGRLYWERPGMFFLRKTADGLDYAVGEFFGKPNTRRRRYSRHKHK